MCNRYSSRQSLFLLCYHFPCSSFWGLSYICNSLAICQHWVGGSPRIQSSSSTYPCVQARGRTVRLQWCCTTCRCHIWTKTQMWHTCISQCSGISSKLPEGFEGSPECWLTSHLGFCPDMILMCHATSVPPFAPPPKFLENARWQLDNPKFVTVVSQFRHHINHT